MSKNPLNLDVKEGKFTEWCKSHGFKDGVSQTAINAALKAGGDAKKMAIFAINFSKGKYKYPKGYVKESLDTNFRYAGSISEGTMRKEDLIPKFMNVLKDLNYSKCEEIKSRYPSLKDLDYDSEEASWLFDELFFALEEEAPSGYYFSTHPDDGADYGFWKDEENDMDNELYESFKLLVENYLPDMKSDEIAWERALPRNFAKTMTLKECILGKIDFDEKPLEEQLPKEKYSLKSSIESLKNKNYKFGE